MPDHVWTEKTVSEQRAALDAGDVTSVQLVGAFTQRIHARNPELLAVIAINPDAAAEAAERDAHSDPPGPLHGIPILIKDNIETRDQPTTAGSLALEHNRTGRDAHLVADLRRAGAVILGKANLSEWANFRSTRSSSGWSAVGGQGRNPHDPTRSPCGSSSGSGIAVAAGMAPAAIGTETNGSIVCPAAVNGIVGVKPTVGLISQSGIVPISHSQDTAGPMTRSVADAALLLSALTGREYPIEGASLAGVRIGVLTEDARFHPDVFEVFEGALAKLQGAGAALVPNLRFEPPRGFRRALMNILFYEFKHDLNAWFRSLQNDYSELTLRRVIEFNEKNAEREMPHFRQELFLAAQAKGGLDEAAYTDSLALAQRATRQDGIDRFLAEHELDALVTASNGPAWTIDHVNGDARVGGNAAYPAVSGYPHVTLPMGSVRGLPVGLSLFGPAQGEAELLRMAAAFEAL